jgi:hypothetical protein
MITKEENRNVGSMLPVLFYAAIEVFMGKYASVSHSIVKYPET